MDLKQCCAFTGHRPHKLPWKYDETDERCIAVKVALAGQIAALASIGVTDFFSGMADGVDVWAAMAVLELKERYPAIRLHCIIPHPGQADRWNQDAQRRYQDILSQADEVRTLSHRYYNGCLQDRNRHLVDAAGYLLAVYDGSGGGTAHTLQYASRKGRRIVIIDPVARVIRRPIVSQA